MVFFKLIFPFTFYLYNFIFCWFGPYLTACNHGMYGNFCNNSCGYCHAEDTCYHVNGTCLLGCEPGYQGDLCKTRKKIIILIVPLLYVCFIKWPKYNYLIFVFPIHRHISHKNNMLKSLKNEKMKATKRSTCILIPLSLI